MVLREGIEGLLQSSTFNICLRATVSLHKDVSRTVSYLQRCVTVFTTMEEVSVIPNDYSGSVYQKPVSQSSRRIDHSRTSIRYRKDRALSPYR